MKHEDFPAVCQSCKAKIEGALAAGKEANFIFCDELRTDGKGTLWLPSVEAGRITEHVWIGPVSRQQALGVLERIVAHKLATGEIIIKPGVVH